MILPTDLLKKMVDDITNIERYNTVSINVMLRNKQDAAFVIDDALVDSFTIEKNFEKNTSDNIQMTLQMKPNQVRELVTKQADLYTDIIIEYVDFATGKVILDEDPLTLQYKVFVHDLSALTKRFSVNAFSKEDGTADQMKDSFYIPVQLQLLTEADHNTNKASFIGMIRNVNVEEIMRYASSVMKIPKLKLETPDNTNKYQVVTIPPDKGGFRAFFEFIHKTYGVYANGFRSYLTNGMLYIYPPFDMKSKRTPKLTILRVSENSYSGMKNYHELKDGNLTIISNSKLSVKTLSNTRNENDGNTKIFIRSDGILDGQVNKKNMKLNNITASMSSKADSTITTGSAVPKYAGSTLNMYGHGSQFSESNTELMDMGWSFARIDMIEPGMTTEFIFDEKDIVMTKTGCVEAVHYSFIKTNKDVYACTAALSVRSDPEAIPYDK